MNPAGAIGIDIGGTSTRVGLVDRDGRVLVFHSFPTPGTYADLLGALINIAREVRSGNDRDVPIAHAPVGLALPALFDRSTGRVRRCVNLPFLQDRSPTADLGEQLHTTVATLTDAEAATWAEFHALGKSDATFAHLRLGTGVALGVIRGGQLLNLTDDRLGHLAELVVDQSDDAPTCPCGRRGCLEELLRAKRASEADGSGEASNNIVRAIATAFANVHNAFAVNHICIGGGLLASRPELFEKVIETAARSKPLSGHSTRMRITGARLGDTAGVIGAALLAITPRHCAPTPRGTTVAT